MSNQVWVCGEVVIDLIPDGTERKAVVGLSLIHISEPTRPY